MYQGHINKQGQYLADHLTYQIEYQVARDWLADIDKQTQEMAVVGSDSPTVEDNLHKVKVRSNYCL